MKPSDWKRVFAPEVEGAVIMRQGCGVAIALVVMPAPGDGCRRRGWRDVQEDVGLRPEDGGSVVEIDAARYWPIVYMR